MSSIKKPSIEREPIVPETEDQVDDDDDGDGNGEEEIDLDEIEPSVLWRSLARYTTELLDDDDWVDPELLPIYSIVLSNLAQVVAKLLNEPPTPETVDDEEVS